MPSGQQIALWRKVDPDFDKYYDATPYGDKALFLSIYSEVFKWFYGFNTPSKRAIPVIVSWTMPKELCDKHKINPGDKFISMTALRLHCRCSTGTTSYWLKKHWIEKQQ